MRMVYMELQPAWGENEVVNPVLCVLKDATNGEPIDNMRKIVISIDAKKSQGAQEIEMWNLDDEPEKAEFLGFKVNTK